MINPVTEVVSGSEATRLLQEESFLEKWRDAFESCPWATVFQSPEFLGTWYRCYRTTYEPLLVYQQGFLQRGGSILFLARDRENGKLVHAGTHHAEYQVWLSPSGAGNAFMSSATATIESRYPRYSLRLQYLPADVPLEWARNGNVAGRILIEKHERPLLDIRDAEELDRYIRKKRRLRTKLNKLKRLGELRYERLRSRSELDAIMDELTTFYDLRHGSLHSILPFAEDSEKRAFYLDLLQQKALIASALSLNGELIGAHLGCCGRGVAHLGVVVHSPRFSGHSPGAHLILEVARDLNRESFRVFDLTPGGDEYKKRFASRCDWVHTLEICPSEGSVRRRKAVAAAEKTARRMISRCGFDPRELKEQVRRTLSRNWRNAPGAAIRKVRHWVKKDTELRVYAMPASEVQGISEQRMARDRLGDLLEFVPNESYQNMQGFLSESLRRLENGNHLYSYVESGQLLHCGWLIERQKVSRFTEVEQEFAYPDNSAVLFDFYTHPAARGRGLYQSALRQMLVDVAAIPGTAYIFISVRADNGPGRHVIEKIGFRHYARVREEVRFGRSTRWTLPAGGD